MLETVESGLLAVDETDDNDDDASRREPDTSAAGMCVCVRVCVLSHLHPCGETRAYKMVLWGVLTLWGNESLPHKE